MGIQQELITALRASSAWQSSAYILTYDESGGYFEHTPSPQLDAYGLRIRVPTWVIYCSRRQQQKDLLCARREPGTRPLSADQNGGDARAWVSRAHHAA